MKQFYILTALAWLASISFGQPATNQTSFGGIQYQTVIRDAGGLPVQNTQITLKMTIRAVSPDGEAVYTETHIATTNIFGLVNLVIGQGTPVNGAFETINWGAAPHFLETALDATGTGNFQTLGVTQFLSVPYALNSLNGMPPGNNPGDMLYWDGSQWMKIAVGQNGQALILQNGIPTWGGVQLPILNTSAVTNITAFTAYGGGNIASDGGSPIVGRGICWNTSPNPTTSNFKVFAGSGAGNFLAQMTQLESSTQYFVRAFATNSAGTSYGQEMTFFTTAGAITLSTTAISNITINSATSGGNITLNGGSPVIARGVCWNTAPYPTVANSKTTDGSGNGTFVSQLTGLANNTQYYVRAYATNILGTSYGNQLTFTTLSGIVTLTTAEVTEITATTAISGGEITSDGGSAVTSRGVCWNTSPNPTTADSFTSDGAGTGTFTSNLTGLAEDTTYYVRAYATNTFGTWYGNEVSFETLVWECGNPIFDSLDGQTYNTVQIGTQCWMAENLNVGTRIDGAQNQTDNIIIEKYCYDDLETNCDVYGGLYQWDEMMGYSTNQDVQGICPSGWHLPKDAEWCNLTTFLDAIVNCAEIGPSGLDVGGKMKETGNTHWGFPNTGASNSSGFTALPGGIHAADGTFHHRGNYGFFWSSTQKDGSTVWDRILYSTSASVYRDNESKSYSSSVRCLNDETATSQLTVTPANQEVTATIGITTFEVTSNTSWTVEEGVAWLTASPINGSSNGTLTVTYEANSSSESRIGQISITASGGNPVVNVTVTQAISPQWSCGQTLMDERDGKNYNTVQIGTQCWMAENLNVGIMIDGNQNQQNNVNIEKYCHSNSEANCNIYGGLYQWNEMMGYSTNQGIKGICPEGWHLPIDIEWTTLTNYLGGEVVAGGKMKEIGTTHWASPNTGATNSSGFTALPGGIRDNGGSFYSLSIYGFWWSSSLGGASYAWDWNLYYNSASVYRGNYDKSFGFSVRCLKDNEPYYPVNPLPEPGSTNNSIIPFLKWSCSDPDGDPLTYDVFFGIENPPAHVATAIADTFFTPGTLNYATIYYWKIVAHDDQGNSTEGEVWSFTTKPLEIGDDYCGGKVAYFFQPGDLGFVEGEVHGLIASPSDQSTAIFWGCYGTSLPGTSMAIGTGQANTMIIVNGCGEYGAAHICIDLVLNGYDDWFLPSKDELNKLFQNKAHIGGFDSVLYWSSSEYDHDPAWGQYFTNGSQTAYNKNDDASVRAVRAF